jgi:hypothetical protein
MKMSETIAELATALAKAQGQIEDATKDGLNPAFRSKYADLAAVRAVIREPLAVNDLAIMQFPRTRQGFVEVETMLIHKTGEFVSETLELPVSKFDAHGIGSGITYGRRYGLMSVLCLAAVDDDGNAAVEKAPAAPTRKAEPKKAEYSDKEIAELARTMKTIAGQGMEALTSKWRSLDPSQREVFDADAVADLKKIAAAVDASKKEAE